MNEHIHQWARRNDLSKPCEITRFTCECGAYGHKQAPTKHGGPKQIRAYVKIPTPNQIAAWQEECARGFSMSSPLGGYQPTPRKEYLGRTQAGWGKWHNDDR